LHGGSDYLRAYQHADQALYAAKHAGRNRAYQHDGQLTLSMLQPA
jgi:PleD family two-component response regulator